MLSEHTTTRWLLTPLSGSLGAARAATTTGSHTDHDYLSCSLVMTGAAAARGRTLQRSLSNVINTFWKQSTETRAPPVRTPGPLRVAHTGRPAAHVPYAAPPAALSLPLLNLPVHPRAGR